MSVICVFVVGLMVCSVTGIVVFEYCTVGSLCRGELHGSYRMNTALWARCVGEICVVVHGSYRMSTALWVRCAGENYMVVTE